MQLHRHSRQAGFPLILPTVSIQIIPDEVTQRCPESAARGRRQQKAEDLPQSVSQHRHIHHEKDENIKRLGRPRPDLTRWAG